MVNDSRQLVLIGDVQTHVPAPGDYSFLGEVWKRMREEVPQAGPIARYIGLRAPRFEDHQLMFLAAEVSDPEQVPEGMFAWVLGSKRWRVLTKQHDQLKTFWEAEAAWLWRHEGPRERPARSGVIGEFRAELPPSWCESASPAVTELSLWHHAYTDFTSEGPDDEIELVEHRSAWRDDYEQMALWLREHLGDHCEYTIEHIGSTSIDGIPAKPIIDVVVATPDMRKVKAIVCPLLDSPLWECWAGDDAKLSYVRREHLGGRRTHHVHLQPKSPDPEPRALFRDFLRTHPEEAARYAALKREILRALREGVGDRRTTGADRERYMLAKNDFVQDILERAQRER